MAQGALDKLGDILNQVQQNRPDRPARPVPETTIVQRPYLGAMLDTVAGDLPPGQPRGVLVTKVNPGGPAEKAGLKEGDRILAFNDKSFTTIEEVGKWMETMNPGDKVILQVIRGNERTVGLTLTIGSRDVEVPVRPTTPRPPRPYDPLDVEGNMPRPADPLPPPQVDDSPRVLGVRVVPLTDQIRAQTGISVRRGAYVESVSRGSVADQANIPVGAVIVAYDGRRVDDAVGLIQLVRNSPADRMIPVNYYYGNRMESTELFFGDPRTLPAQPGPGGTPAYGDDRPALRILQKAMEAMESGGELPGGIATQEQVDSLSRRVRDLEQEVRQLREELRTLKSSRDL
ncbi:PDZ domain-containing protein [Bremerella volcania]|nr:PDZ domain-containing protein [Bremerella volcania]